MMQSEQGLSISGAVGEHRKILEVSIKRRGRPKGALSASLSEVRAQAAEEKRLMRDEMQEQILLLRQQLVQAEEIHQQEIAQLQEILSMTRKREESYRAALQERLQLVATHLHDTLLDWGEAELKEGEVYKRRRGRPRKTLK